MSTKLWVDFEHGNQQIIKKLYKSYLPRQFPQAALSGGVAPGTPGSRGACCVP